MLNRRELVNALKIQIDSAIWADEHHVDAIPLFWLKEIVELIDPDVLKFDKIFDEYNHRLCFVECKSEDEIKAAMLYNSNSVSEYVKMRFVGDAFNHFEHASQYNKTWRCWNIEPSYEKRMEVPWDD